MRLLGLSARDAARGCCQRKVLSRAQRGGGLKPACCTELAHLPFFFFLKLCPQALPFLFPFWTGLLHSPRYRHYHRCLLPCHGCGAQGPHGTDEAPGQGEGKPGSHTTAQTASARACATPATPRLQQNPEHSLPAGLRAGCMSTARLMGQGAGSGEPQQRRGTSRRWLGAALGR